MLLHTPLGAQRERLGNLAPAAAGIAQRLQPLLLGRRPWRVRAPLLRRRAGERVLHRRKAQLDVSRAGGEGAVRVADAEGAGVAAGRSGQGGLVELRGAPFAWIDGRGEVAGLLELLRGVVCFELLLLWDLRVSVLWRRREGEGVVRVVRIAVGLVWVLA